MNFYGIVLVTGLLLLSFSQAEAEEASENGSFPPEKTSIIYETLLPAEQDGGKSLEPQGEAPEYPVAGGGKMTGEKIVEIMRRRDIILQGSSGRWQFLHEGMQFFLLIDAEHNRMRLMTPLAKLDSLRQDPGFNEIELLQRMLKANYLATGDVRLCLNRHVLWAAFLHPFDSLTKRDLLNAVEQTVAVAQKVRGEAG